MRRSPSKAAVDAARLSHPSHALARGSTERTGRTWIPPNDDSRGPLTTSNWHPDSAVAGHCWAAVSHWSERQRAAAISDHTVGLSDTVTSAAVSPSTPAATGVITASCPTGFIHDTPSRVGHSAGVGSASSGIRALGVSAPASRIATDPEAPGASSRSPSLDTAAPTAAPTSTASSAIAPRVTHRAGRSRSGLTARPPSWWFRLWRSSTSMALSSTTMSTRRTRSMTYPPGYRSGACAEPTPRGVPNRHTRRSSPR